MATIDELMRPIIEDAAMRGVVSQAHGGELCEKLRQMALLNAIVAGWTKTGANYPHFDFFEARDAHFELLPLGSMEIRRTTTQSIPDASATAISFDNVTRKEGSVFKWSSSDPTKIYFTERGAKTIAVIGRLDWPSHATGYRNAHVATYNSSDVLQTGATMAQLPPVDGHGTSIPFALSYSYLPVDNYFSIMAQQESGGGALNLNYASVGLFLLK